jgi:hypothetical protein
MCEAAVHSGMKPAIWVKYRPSSFHNKYSNKYCITWIKNKAENLVVYGIIKKNTEKQKSNLKFKAYVTTRISYRVSGFVHLA